MKVHIVHKVLSGLSAILSLTLLLTCIWTLTSLFLSEAEKENNCSRSFRDPGCDEGDSGHQHHQQGHSSQPSFEDEQDSHDTIVIESSEGNWRTTELLAHFGEMTRRFRIIVIICLCGIIVASLVQFVCSAVLLFTPSYNMGARTRRICWILLAVFIVYLAGFAWPLAYNREHSGPTDNSDDSLHSMSTLNGSIKEFFNHFHWKQWLTELNLYYLELFCNMLFLFVHMVIACCTLRCMDYHDFNV